VYAPSAEEVHVGGHATARASTRMLAEHHRSAYRYLADRHPGPRWAPLRLVLRAGLELRWRLLARRG
jgi:N-acetylglucosaminyl-diphospho-decaprenol L-rhamnosyltransferase